MTAATTLGLVDYGMGNRRSVHKALERAGARVLVSSDPQALRDAAGLVVPGVGAFPRAMERLRSLGLDELLRDVVAQGRPVLGICLGLQLAFDGSDELGGAAGLGLIPGRVRTLEGAGVRLPHIGWNEVDWRQEDPIAREIPSGTAFYHVHSFAPVPDDPGDVVATADYGSRFVTAARRGSFTGVQFHPEKSSTRGLTLLANFAAACGTRPGTAGQAAAAAGRG